MNGPRLLDLFCGAGGAGMGYHRAGFHVVGVDIEPQPRYCGDEFIQADALSILRAMVDYPSFSGEMWRPGYFAAVHASPPCQDWSTTKDFGGDHGTGWLLMETRRLLQQIGLPWVLENVQGSPLAEQQDLFGANGLVLCGCMFPSHRGLIYEDRVFETSFPVPQPPHVKHVWPQNKMGRPLRPGECMQVTGHFSDVPEAQRRYGAPWMTQGDLAQAIPPAYSEHIGAQLLAHIQGAAA